jgi:hypothetical protein
MKLNDIKKATQNIEEGGWVGELPNLPGVSVRVRGAFNSEYNKLLSKLRAELTPEEWSDPEMQEALDTKLVHETILVDWHGIEDAQYSSDAALDLLSNKEFAVFRRAVNYAASVVAREGRKSLEEDAKN